MDTLNQITGVLTAPEGYTLVVNLIIGGIMKGLVELASKHPSIPNTLAIPVVLVVGIGLSWGASLILAPGLEWDVIITVTMAGFGFTSAGKTMFTK